MLAWSNGQKVTCRMMGGFQAQCTLQPSIRGGACIRAVSPRIATAKIASQDWKPSRIRSEPKVLHSEVVLSEMILSCQASDHAELTTSGTSQSYLRPRRNPSLRRIGVSNSTQLVEMVTASSSTVAPGFQKKEKNVEQGRFVVHPTGAYESGIRPHSTASQRRTAYPGLAMMHVRPGKKADYFSRVSGG